mgnify:CR=1 FL=1
MPPNMKLEDETAVPSRWMVRIIGRYPPGPFGGPGSGIRRIHVPHGRNGPSTAWSWPLGSHCRSSARACPAGSASTPATQIPSPTTKASRAKLRMIATSWTHFPTWGRPGGDSMDAP